MKRPLALRLLSSIKYCRQRADLFGIKLSPLPMFQAIVILGAVLAVFCQGTVAQGPQPPPAQQSPAIIMPPGPAPAQTPPQTPAPEAKPAAGKAGKGKVDPSTVPAKDPTAVGPAYVIGPEDALFVRVWQNGELSGQVNVGPDGTISLQLIGEVKVAGMTPHQLEEELDKRFLKFIKEPVVNVQVLQVRSRTYILQGDGVNRPGIYPLTRPLTVEEALLAGGGYSPFANKKKIYVLRGTKKFYFNLNDVVKGKHLDQNIYIQNGDQIFVP